MLQQHPTASNHDIDQIVILTRLIKTQPTATNPDVVHIPTKQLCIQRTCIAYKFGGEKLSLREIVIDGLFVWCILYLLFGY